MVSKREEDIARRKKNKDEITTVFNENSKTVKSLSANEREKLQEMNQHLGKLLKYYPPESGKPYSTQIDITEFRDCEGIRLKSVESNIPLVLDTLAIHLDTGIVKLLIGKKTSKQVINDLIKLFEDAQKWIMSIGSTKGVGLFMIPHVNAWIDDLIMFNESSHFANSNIIREILYCDCELSMREHLEMLVYSFSELLDMIPQLQARNPSDEEISSIVEYTFERYGHKRR